MSDTITIKFDCAGQQGETRFNAKGTTLRQVRNYLLERFGSYMTGDGWQLTINGYSTNAVQDDKTLDQLNMPSGSQFVFAREAKKVVVVAPQKAVTEFKLEQKVVQNSELASKEEAKKTKKRRKGNA